MFSDLLFGTPSGIISSNILSDILSGMSSDTLSDILSGMSSDILSDIVFGMSCHILSGISSQGANTCGGF